MGVLRDERGPIGVLRDEGGATDVLRGEGCEMGVLREEGGLMDAPKDVLRDVVVEMELPKAKRPVGSLKSAVC